MDFFISYHPADKEKADWIGWQLEEARYTVWTPDWDIQAGNTEILAIDQALMDAAQAETERRVILVLSPHFEGRSIQENVWTTIIAHDPDGAKGVLIPVIVLPNPHIPNSLHSFRAIDLSGCKDEAKAVSLLLAGIRLERHKPDRKPRFWGSGEMPKYWGETELDASKDDKPSPREAIVPEKKTAGP